MMIVVADFIIIVVVGGVVPFIVPAVVNIYSIIMTNAINIIIIIIITINNIGTTTSVTAGAGTGSSAAVNANSVVAVVAVTTNFVAANIMNVISTRPVGWRTIYQTTDPLL